MFNDSLIMAGGSGTRLWPASSSRLPKQFLRADDKEGKSFFSLALDRAFAVSERVIVIAGGSHINHIIKDAQKFPVKEKKRIVLIVEPEAKNTAPAIACAAVYSRFCGQNKNMIVLTSDHIIEPLETFIKDAALAEKAANEDKLVVFGIRPARAETGYGYIETESASQSGVHGKRNAKNILNVAAFHEKPDMQTAKKYAAGKNYFWNSGMFAFADNFITEQFKCFAPRVLKPFEKLKQPCARDYTVSKGVKILAAWNGLGAAYKKTEKISFDYAIAEKCANSAMIESNFKWIDIGSWDDYAQLKQWSQLKQRGKNDNEDLTPVFNASSNNCFVDSDIPVALAGADDLIVVIRSGKKGAPASALIVKKGQTQKVKDIVEQIKNNKRDDLL